MILHVPQDPFCLTDSFTDQQRYSRNPTDRSSRPNVAAIIRSEYRSLLYMFFDFSRSDNRNIPLKVE
jgi:hypothetical protein